MPHIVLGIGGGIAAYKAAELARALIERGCTVQVVMTVSAQEFVRPLTFAALTGRKVVTGMFGEEGPIEHISLIQEADAFVVAPATANLLGKFANGIADDFLSTAYLAYDGKVLLAPAMNTKMWLHPATQRNVETLRARGHAILPPDEGMLACGTTGPGRLPDPVRIADAVMALLVRRLDLAGETVLVTAGPTEEPVDPVRYISNRSSGKMGYAIAEEAAARGAEVVLVSGPVNLPPPAGVTLVRVSTALEMRDAVMAHFEKATIIVKAAAVADYRVKNPATQKIKKSAAATTLELEPNPDILAELGGMKGGRLLIGFAAETGDAAAEARRKLESKRCDIVVGNRVDGERAVFGADDNEVVLALRSGETVNLARAPKRTIAAQIFDYALKLK